MSALFILIEVIGGKRDIVIYLLAAYSAVFCSKLAVCNVSYAGAASVALKVNVVAVVVRNALAAHGTFALPVLQAVRDKSAAFVAVAGNLLARCVGKCCAANVAFAVVIGICMGISLYTNVADAVVVFINVVELCFANVALAVKVFVLVYKLNLANVADAVVIGVSMLHRRTAFVALTVCVGIRMVLVVLSAVYSIVRTTDIALVIAVFIVVVNAGAAFVASVVAVGIGVCALGADEVIISAANIAFVIVVVIAMVKAYFANVAKSVVALNVFMYARTALVALGVGVSVGVLGTDGGVLLAAVVAKAVAVFVCVSFTLCFAAGYCSE